MLTNDGCRITALFTIIVLFVSGCNQSPRTTQTPHGKSQANVGLRGVRHKGVETVKEDTVPCDQELKRKEMAERMDKLDMLYTARVAVDKDSKMLDVPTAFVKYVNKEFTVAETPPEVEFSIIPVEPKFVSVFNNQYESGWWGNYCQSNFDESSGKFYSGVADHGTYDPHLYLVEYDPALKQVRCLPELNRSLGRSREHFGDGIIHGWLDFYQSAHLARPHLWFCSYWGKFPEPEEADYATGYDGGHIFSYDPVTEEYIDYGAPLPRTSWPYHRVDGTRGMLYAVSLFNEFLSWDINSQKVRWAGCLPDSMKWYTRAILLDEETGMVYTTNDDESDPERHMIRYDPVKNRFSTLDCHMPKNTRTGSYDHMRAQTRDRGPDGLIWGVTSSGQLFAFDPDKEAITDKGLNWPGDSRYTCTMERSPGGRYIYYQVMSEKNGSPVIQYDTETGTKKVLAFMFPFYYEKYGYVPTGSYSFKLDSSGEKLFMVWNGAFYDYDGDMGTERFGHCSVMLMHIPASERVE